MPCGKKMKIFAAKDGENQPLLDAYGIILHLSRMRQTSLRKKLHFAKQYFIKQTRDHGLGFVYSLQCFSIRVEKRELFEEDDIFSVRGVALGEDCHLTYDVTACLLDELYKCV